MNTRDNQTPIRILFADDEVHLQESMRREIPRMGHVVAVCPDGDTAIAALEKEAFDCLLVDLDMPGKSGIDLIIAAKKMYPDIEAVIMTGKPTEQSAIAAIKHGVFDYLNKPTRLADIAVMFGRIAQRISDRKLLAALHQRIRHNEGNSELVGSGEAMKAVRKLISKVAPTDATVLIRGETGCGKELVARELHSASLRAKEPLVPINCGALPEHLIESELFGHCKGAYTGADSARMGLFEVASGGTIFLDEIGELPLQMQAKLLRVLETGDIRRVGDNQTLHVDVRVVCATHRDLEGMVAQGTFREDLMFRINTFEVHVPSLRQRIEDIEPLAVHLLRRYRADATAENSFTPAAIRQLTSHTWPGNVRELANVIKHAAILSDSLPIDDVDLPQHFAKRSLRKEIQDGSPRTLREVETMAIEQALQRHGGNKPAAAEELGVSLKTLYNRLNAADEKRAAG
jgi:DNA-binding NtrC family response regulator